MHVVLGAELARIVWSLPACRRAPRRRSEASDHCGALIAARCGAAGDERQLNPSTARKAGGKIAADRASAIHRRPSLWPPYSAACRAFGSRLARKCSCAAATPDPGSIGTDIAQRHLAARQRLQDHDLVEPADMADAEHACRPPLSVRRRATAVAVIGGLHHVIAVEAFRHEIAVTVSECHFGSLAHSVGPRR